MNPTKFAVTVLLSMTLALAHAAIRIEPVDFAVDGNAAQPSLTVDPQAGFVLTWQQRGPELSTLGYAVIDAQGQETRRGIVAQGRDWFVNGADFPSLAVLANGDWVTYWLQKTAPDTYAYAIRSVRSRDQGRSWDAPVTIHRDGTDTEHGFVAMSPAGADRVLMAWFDGRRMAGADPHAHEGAGEHMSLRAAVLGRDGQLREEHELDDLTCSCCQTDMVRGRTRTLQWPLVATGPGACRPLDDRRLPGQRAGGSRPRRPFHGAVAHHGGRRDAAATGPW
jgi:hypothetical protein